jgi:hypothetical protein
MADAANDLPEEESPATPVEEVAEEVAAEKPADDLAGLGGEAQGPAAEGAAPPPTEEEPGEIVVPSPSSLTIALFVLNLLAALGLGYLLLLDYGVRQAWSYAVFQRDLAIWGLPLAEEERHVTGSETTRPPVHIDPARIAEVFRQRQRGGKADKFEAVNEVLTDRIKPSQLSDDVLRDLFKGVPEASKPVRTLEEEVDRVQKRFFGDVEAAAQEAVKTTKKKRQALRDLLLPLAPTIPQLEALDQKIKALKPAELDPWLLDAGQRWVLVNLLRVLDWRRPETSQNILANSADPTAVKLDQIKDAVNDRFLQAKSGGPGQLGKESYSRRQNIAFLLYAISKTRKPGNTADWLYPDGWKRVEVVIGLWEYDKAAGELIQALHAQQERTLREIAEDRDGYAIQVNGKLENVPGFVGRYQQAVWRIYDLVHRIKEQEARLTRLKEIEAQQKTQYEGRKKDYDDVVDKLLAARRETAIQAAELRRLEGQLFRAQRELADAAQTNEELERQIRAAERAARGRTEP